MKSNFENLRVYQLSEEIADRIWHLVIEWDRFAKTTVGVQVVRAADSVGANIAEGDGRGSYADNKRFVRTARGSLNETKHFLRRAYRRDLLKRSDVEALKPLVDELGPKLNSYLKSIGRARSSPPISTDH
jgi:four helix bundle protein